MSIQSRIEKLEAQAPKHREQCDLSRLTSEELADFERLIAIAPKVDGSDKLDYAAMSDESLDQLYKLLARCTPPEATGSHGSGIFPDCACTYCEAYNLFHRLPLPPPGIYTREWYRANELQAK